ncbi:MAG: acyl-CoA dehydrogenase family protein [Actinomycetota bacterium]
MDFAFSDEQQMLRDQARQFLKDRFPEDRVVELADSDEGWDPKSWKEIADLGWVGLSTPEDKGGAGMSFLDEAVIFEEMGYALYPGLYFATVALALPALEAHPDGSLLEKVMAGDTAASFSNDADRVVDGDKAEVVFLTVDGSVVAFDAPEPKTLTTVDRTRRLASVATSGGTPVAEGEAARDLVHTIRLRSLAAAALEAVGVAQKAHDLAREYVKERQQFGKPIGQYQAVSHQVADTYLHVELARSLAYWAAWCVAESDEQAERAVLAAKAQATEAAVFACERSIQVHGGIGFTWEHILHRYYKRAQWLQGFEGFPSAQLSELADKILA